MTGPEEQSDGQAIDLARECLYRFLAAALTDPWAGAWPLLYDADGRTVACEAAELLRAEAGTSASVGLGELPPAYLDLRRVFEELPATPDDLQAEYDRVFGLVLARECPPYETEYHPADQAFFRAQQMADVAGFYRAFGVEPSRGRADRPDHIALELEFMAFLLMKKRLAQSSPNGYNEEAGEAARICGQAETAFFRDHLAWWVPAFASGLKHRAGTGAYAALGQVLAALWPLERTRLGVAAPRLPLQAAVEEAPEEAGACGACTVS